MNNVKSEEKREYPCPNCKEEIKLCACMRNICQDCGAPVGNITFTICDDCWDKTFPDKETIEETIARVEIEQEKILACKNIDWEQMEKTYINIQKNKKQMETKAINTINNQMHNTKTGEDIIFQYGQRVLEAISATFLNKDNQSKADRVADKEIFQAVGETILNFPLPPCDDLVPKQSATIDREEQAEVDALVDLIMDEPGIEIDCSNFPYCKCDKEKVRCVNYMGLAKKIIDRQKNKFKQTAGEGKDEEIKRLREALEKIANIEMPVSITSASRKFYLCVKTAKEALNPS